MSHINLRNTAPVPSATASGPAAVFTTTTLNTSTAGGVNSNLSTQSTATGVDFYNVGPNLFGALQYDTSAIPAGAQYVPGTGLLTFNVYNADGSLPPASGQFTVYEASNLLGSTVSYAGLGTITKMGTLSYVSLDSEISMTLNMQMGNAFANANGAPLVFLFGEYGYNGTVLTQKFDGVSGAVQDFGFTTVPEPSTLWVAPLLLVAIAVKLFAKRRRRA